MPHDHTLALTLVERPDLPSATLQALYRITGRSTVELRHAIQGGDALYTAPLFGREHIEVVPRLEKSMAFLAEHGLAYTITESYDGVDQLITIDTLREILHAPS